MGAGTVALAFLALQPGAGDLRATDNVVVVSVTGIKSDQGQIGCGLFRSEDGFPMKSERAVMRWQPARKGRVTCQFEGLPAGRYAVSVSHDLNGNRKTDTNFIGLPREDWGVSNNVRPSMRAPRFNEAAFDVQSGRETRIEIGVDR
jgi:uncharacterized protein (DUF2141 family)